MITSNMIHKALTLSVLVLLVTGSSAGQTTRRQQHESTSTEAKLVRRYSNLIKGSYRLEEDSIDLADQGALEPDARVAIRLCSQKPLLQALRRPFARPEFVVEYLTGIYRMPAERILFLRSADCMSRAGRRAKRADVELWVIPPGAVLPAATEATDLTTGWQKRCAEGCTKHLNAAHRSSGYDAQRSANE